MRKTDNEWLNDAACKGVVGYPFFSEEPTDNCGGDTEGAEDARRLCDTCPVRVECLLEALHFERGVQPVRRHGISGGYTPLERYVHERRGHVTCPVCGSAYDPTAVRAGLVSCPTDSHHEVMV